MEAPKPRHRRMNPKRPKEIPAKSKAAVRERSGDRCEMRIMRVCNGRGEEFHHRKPRSALGSHCPINILHGCTPCHHEVTIRAPGTAKFRTMSYQEEGLTEQDFLEELEALEKKCDDYKHRPQRL